MSLLTLPYELKEKKTFVGLIYGQPGIGKTTLALSAPNPVLYDIDKGIDRVQPQFRTPSLQVDTYDQVLELTQSDEINQFDTVVIDTLGKLIDKIGLYVVKNNPKIGQSDGQLTMKGWGAVKAEFLNFFKLLSNKNKSIIFVAHETEEKNDDIVVKRPDCSGSARKDIVKELDFMGYMEIIGNNRTISFSPSARYYAKNSLGLEGSINVPDTKDGNYFISQKIVKLTNEKMLKNANLTKKYTDIMQSLEQEINSLSNASEVSKFISTLSSKPKTWDSEFKAKKLLNDHIKKINVGFDKETKKFYDIKQEQAVND